MKTAIVYASTHHGNTKKLLDAIAAAYEVDLIDAVKIPEKDLNRYDRIGFASGIYYSKFHQAVLNFAAVNMPQNKQTFFYQHLRRQSGLYFDRKSADSQKQRPSGKIWMQGL